MPLFLERRKLPQRSRSLVDIMHASSQRRSLKKKEKKALVHQQEQSGHSTDSTVSSSRDSVCSSTTGSFTMESDKAAAKLVRFSTVAIRVMMIGADDESNHTNTVESVDRYEIRKTAKALEREIEALKLEEYHRMAASSRSRKKQASEEASEDAVQPRRIRVVTRSPQQSPSFDESPSPSPNRRRRILVRASSLSQLSLPIMEDLPPGRGVTPEKENVKNNIHKPPLVDKRFRFLRSDSFSVKGAANNVDPRGEAVQSPVDKRIALRFRRADSFLSPVNGDGNQSPVENKRSALRFLRSESFSVKQDTSTSLDSKRKGSFSGRTKEAIRPSPVDKRGTFRFLRADSVPSLLSPRKKRDVP